MHNYGNKFINIPHTQDVLDLNDRKQLEGVIDEMRAELEMLSKLRDAADERISTLEASLDVLERVLGQ